MGNAVAGKESGVRVSYDPANPNSKFDSLNTSSGNAYGSNGNQVDGANSVDTPTGRNMLESTDFFDEAENNEPGLKTGEWTIEANWDPASAGLTDLQSAHDNGDLIEVAAVPDEASPTAGGYEMTCYVSQFDFSTGANDKVTVSIQLVCGDGDGWSALIS